MRNILGLALLGSMITSPAWAQQPLFLAYPPKVHQTRASQIFLIGTASPEGEVLVNGKVIPRSPAGNFAPSFPLQLGDNQFNVRYQGQEIKVKVKRLSTEPVVPVGLAFGEDSLKPAVDIARLPGERICFGAIASPEATVSVKLGNQTIPLKRQSSDFQLPPNSAALTSQNQPDVQSAIGKYEGCAIAEAAANLGQPQYQLNLNGQTISQSAPGKVAIISPVELEVVEVTVEAGVARTGPSTNYSRLTPLPQGTRAAVTGREGEWVRLDYGAWIKAAEVRTIPNAVPPHSLIRSIVSRQVAGATEIVFPLEVPVPVRVQQGEKTLTLTLYNTTAQTDIFRLDDDPVIKRLDWQQTIPGQIDYTFNLKSERQWGYDLRYEGTTLILSLRHPPKVSTQSLSGVSILLDPGHGGDEFGARGPNGYPEKDINLVISKLLQQELKQRGARVYLTRETDKFVSLGDRVKMINELKPTLAFSVHYNALPDSGDAIKTAGIGMFWYHAQAHDLSVFLQEYLVTKLNRPHYGIFWDNLALTRPHTAPTILLELGFMINPLEFEWITNSQEQQKLAAAIADGIMEWLG
ncbi:MAG: N-acetylmuramoyl-L-alanine amidase, partial [Symploca sp. SIO1B1]|nr:N-acetylmuramoyl-L-alanine amidase [Symploca sp. SIO1B1]